MRGWEVGRWWGREEGAGRGGGNDPVLGREEKEGARWGVGSPHDVERMAQDRVLGGGRICFTIGN